MGHIQIIVPCQEQSVIQRFRGILVMNHTVDYGCRGFLFILIADKYQRTLACVGGTPDCGV